jgi:hypothetical protein
MLSSTLISQTSLYHPSLAIFPHSKNRTSLTAASSVISATIHQHHRKAET